MTPEMYYLEESQMWTCPIDGRWKVICVGGGASGGLLKSDLKESLITAGQSTSFGNLIYADGGEAIAAAVSNVNVSMACSGHGGYDGINYGGTVGVANNSALVSVGTGNCPTPSTLINSAETAFGWGAGGGTATGSTSYRCCPGRAGKVKTMIANIAAGEEVPCTVGTGGVAPEHTVEKSYIANGADGVIILQYLGE